MDCNSQETIEICTPYCRPVPRLADSQYAGLVNMVQIFWTPQNFSGRDLIGQYTSHATQSINTRDLLAVGMTLASLSVQTTAGLSCMGGW